MSHQVSNCCLLLPLLSKLWPVVGDPDQCESESPHFHWLANKTNTSIDKIVGMGVFRVIYLGAMRE